DSRSHSPAISGFDSATGAAPDFYKITATGGAFCINELIFNLTTSGGAALSCYKLTIFSSTFPGGVSCLANGTGGCSINQGGGSYADNSTVIFKLEKTCSSATRERVTYTVSGHL